MTRSGYDTFSPVLDRDQLHQSTDSTSSEGKMSAEDSRPIVHNIQGDSDEDSSCSEHSGEGEQANLISGQEHLINHHHLAPKDRFKAVYLIFYLLGIGTLLPWNMFITAKDYFSYQLRNTSLVNGTYTDPQNETPLQISYESAVAMASMIPNIVMQVLNTLLAGKVSMSKRIIGSMVLMVVMFILTLVFTKLDVSTWQTIFYTVTLASVVIMSAASALLQSSLFGLVARFPQAYTQAIMGGMGLGGVFAALAEIITISLGGTVVSSAFMYFLLAVLVVAISLVAYLLLYKFEYAKHHHKVYQKVLLDSRALDENRSLVSDYLAIIKKIWRYAMSVTIVFLVTLALFPATTSNVKSMTPGANLWTLKYFLPVYCFLLFNVGDLLGRTLAGVVNMPKPGILIPILSILRLVFFPLFALCNVHPRGSLPVIFDNDAYPMVIMAVFAISNGYLSTQALMVAPTLVTKRQSELAGTMMSVFMTAGLSIGSALSYAIVIMIKDL